MYQIAAPLLSAELHKKSSLFTLVLICLTLLLSATSVEAGKIYKWTDENGKVHFSSVPPSKRENVSSQIKEVETSKTRAEKRLTNSSLSGDWWTFKDSSTTRKLSLSYRDFEIYDYKVGPYSTYKKKIASGEYKFKNSELKLTYFNHYESPEKLDKSEVFFIRKLNNNKLSFSLRPGQNQIYRRHDRSRNVNSLSRELLGRWEDESGIGYKFGHGTVKVYKQVNNRDFLKMGNWVTKNGRIVITYSIDLNRPIRNQDRVDEWIIESKTPVHLSLIHADKKHYKRLSKVK